MASTGAYPAWICRALRYGNDSLDRPASVSRPISVRDAGPCTDSSVVPDVTSVTVRNSPDRVARLVQPLGVDQPAGPGGHVVGGQPAEHRGRTRSLNQELGHQAHVEQADRLAHRGVLTPHDLMGRGPAPTQAS